MSTEYLHSAKFMRRFAGARMIMWALLLPIVELTSIKTSIPFVIAISLYANFATDWTNYEAARVEVKQDAQGDVEVDTHGSAEVDFEHVEKQRGE